MDTMPRWAAESKEALMAAESVLDQALTNALRCNAALRKEAKYALALVRRELSKGFVGEPRA